MAYIDVDKDIRYFTDTLEERIDNTQGEVNTLMADVDGLRVTIQELVAVTKKHADKIDGAVICIQTLNKMVEIPSKHVEIPDESE